MTNTKEEKWYVFIGTKIDILLVSYLFLFCVEKKIFIF